MFNSLTNTAQVDRPCRHAHDLKFIIHQQTGSTLEHVVRWKISFTSSSAFSIIQNNIDNSKYADPDIQVQGSHEDIRWFNTLAVYLDFVPNLVDGVKVFLFLYWLVLAVMCTFVFYDCSTLSVINSSYMLASLYLAVTGDYG